MGRGPAGPDPDGLAGHRQARDRPCPGARVGLRFDRAGGDVFPPVGRRARRRPAGGHVRGGRRRVDRGRVRALRDFQFRQARAGMPPQPALLAQPGLPGGGGVRRPVRRPRAADQHRQFVGLPDGDGGGANPRGGGNPPFRGRARGGGFDPRPAFGRRRDADPRGPLAGSIFSSNRSRWISALCECPPRPLSCRPRAP